jgi:hypothetical protein
VWTVATFERVDTLAIRSRTWEPERKEPACLGREPDRHARGDDDGDVRADALRAQVLLRAEPLLHEAPDRAEEAEHAPGQHDQRDAVAELRAARGRLAALVGGLLPATGARGDREHALIGDHHADTAAHIRPQDVLGEVAPHDRAAAALGVDAEDLVLHHHDLDQVAERNSSRVRCACASAGANARRSRARAASASARHCRREKQAARALCQTARTDDAHARRRARCGAPARARGRRLRRGEALRLRGRRARRLAAARRGARAARRRPGRSRRGSRRGRRLFHVPARRGGRRFGRVYAVDVDDDMVDYLATRARRSARRERDGGARRVRRPEAARRRDRSAVHLQHLSPHRRPHAYFRRVLADLAPNGHVAIVEYDGRGGWFPNLFGHKTPADEIAREMREAGYERIADHEILTRQSFQIFRADDGTGE